jgi:hypothetical protein
MRTLTVTIDEREFVKLGFTSEQLSFSELKQKIHLTYAQEALAKCHRFAKETGLAKMTPEAIDAEIQAVRTHAKNRH